MKTFPDGSRLTIALIPNKMLGDGIITLLLANNLHINSFEVTVFHDFILPLNEWFPFNIKPVNEELDEAVLDSFDIVLADTFSNFSARYSGLELEKIAQKIIFFSSGKLHDVFYHNHEDRLRIKLSGHKSDFIDNFASASRVIKFNKTNSMVENFTIYCKDTLNLPIVTDQPGYSLPDNLVTRHQKKRVVISPTSSLAKKEWGAHKFISLAQKIKANGQDVFFTFAPEEREKWLVILNGEFNAPEFQGIKEFATFLANTDILIGNDSGAGHLASSLGKPVLTIVSSPKKKNFRWRPGWGDNMVVTPPFTFSVFGKGFWRPFLTVNKVFENYQVLLESAVSRQSQ